MDGDHFGAIAQPLGRDAKRMQIGGAERLGCAARGGEVVEHLKQRALRVDGPRRAEGGARHLAETLHEPTVTLVADACA